VCRAQRGRGLCVGLKFIIFSLLENLPDDVSPGQAIWCPDDLGVICVGWWHTPYRLGRIYCAHRRSAMFHIDLKNYTCTTLGPTDHSVSNPVFSRDQTRLVFLDNSAGGPHRQCSRLAFCDWYVMLMHHCQSFYCTVYYSSALCSTLVHCVVHQCTV